MSSEQRTQEAFRAFVREHQAALRGFVRMRGVHNDSVDDLAQETFLIAYRELDRFDQDRDFGKWLRGIARNLVRNELRRNARRGRLMDEEVTRYLLAVQSSDHADQRYGSTRASEEPVSMMKSNRISTSRLSVRSILHGPKPIAPNAIPAQSPKISPGGILQSLPSKTSE